ncbi:hypothetical protein NMY22_g14481 [Coprinellus aureogranulatus]|nr:hypothetical protein NMY22_g14481 [Coprinellus aureogranulatus]
MVWEYVCVTNKHALSRLADVAVEGPKHDDIRRLGAMTKRLDVKIRVDKPEDFYESSDLARLLKEMPNLSSLVVDNRPPLFSRPARHLGLPHLFSEDVLDSIAECKQLRDLQFRDAVEVPTFEGLVTISRGCLALRRLQITNVHFLGGYTRELGREGAWGFRNLEILKVGHSGSWYRPEVSVNLDRFLELLTLQLPTMPTFRQLHLAHPLHEFRALAAPLTTILHTGVIRWTPWGPHSWPGQYRSLGILVVEVTFDQESALEIPHEFESLHTVHLREMPVRPDAFRYNLVHQRAVDTLKLLSRHSPPMLRYITLWIPSRPRQPCLDDIHPLVDHFRRRNIDFVVDCHPLGPGESAWCDKIYIRRPGRPSTAFHERRIDPRPRGLKGFDFGWRTGS